MTRRCNHVAVNAAMACALCIIQVGEQHEPGIVTDPPDTGAHWDHILTTDRTPHYANGSNTIVRGPDDWA